jgi:DNA-binding response OmpR family regulator
MTADILIVDDEPHVVSLLVATLEWAGFDNLAVATNGADALEAAHRELPRLIFLDALMPDKDGFSVCAELKRDPSTASIHICILTALAQAGDAQKALRALADDYITKPFGLIEIEAKAREVLGMPAGAIC